MNPLSSLLMRKNSLLGEQKLPAHGKKIPCLCNAIDDAIEGIQGLTGMAAKILACWQGI